MVHNIDFAQYLFSYIDSQRPGELQSIHHDVCELFSDHRASLRILAVHQFADIVMIQPLEMLQKLAHLDGHGHGDMLRILHTVVAPAFADTEGVNLFFQLRSMIPP